MLFLYLAPFFVVIGSRWLRLGDRFDLWQWLGLLLSFVGIVIAFGLPTPAANPRQALGDVMLVGAAAAWAATILVVKASPLNRISPEKTLLYQLVVSAPLLGRRGNTSTTRNRSCGGCRSLSMRTSVISGDQRNWFSRYTRRSAERRARR